MNNISGTLKRSFAKELQSRIPNFHRGEKLEEIITLIWMIVVLATSTLLGIRRSGIAVGLAMSVCLYNGEFQKPKVIAYPSN